MRINGKAELISSKEIITQKRVAEVLDITLGSAGNLLTQWHRQGVLHRTAPGLYISAYVKSEQKKLQIDSLKLLFGEDMVLIGASSWEEAGWCDSEILHIAIPARPSRRMPKTFACSLYPVGAKHYLHLVRNCLPGMDENPPSLHPVAQMLWWLEPECPAPMPDPKDVFWEKFKHKRELNDAVSGAWPEFENIMDVESLYEMIHMDKLTGNFGLEPALDTEDSENDTSSP